MDDLMNGSKQLPKLTFKDDVLFMILLLLFFPVLVWQLISKIFMMIKINRLDPEYIKKNWEEYFKGR